MSVTVTMPASGVAPSTVNHPDGVRIWVTDGMLKVCSSMDSSSPENTIAIYSAHHWSNAVIYP